MREWLDGQVAGGLLAWDEASDRYELGPEAAMALADDESPAFVARAMNAIGSVFIDMPKVAEAFRGNGALSWGAHHPCLFSGTEWFFRTGYRAELPNWIAALDGVAEKLHAGASVADVGCGHGASVVVIAQAFPEAHITGFDFHAPSITTAEERAAEAGVSAQTTFEVADAKSYDGTFDLICFFDCLHDMGDPVGIARHALDHLAEDGTVLLVEPFALDGRAENMTSNPMAALLYTVVVRHLHAELAVAGGRARSRRPGRRGPPPRGLRASRLHDVPPGRGDPAQPHPRSQALTATRLHRARCTTMRR